MGVVSAGCFWDWVTLGFGDGVIALGVVGATAPVFAVGFAGAVGLVGAIGLVGGITKTRNPLYLT